MQVQKEHYDFKKYVTPQRWMSYYYQICEVIKNDDYSSVLIIGKGDDIVPAILEKLCESKEIHTFDFDAELKPTYVGDVRKLSSIVTKKYDVIICCQVLEHLEWKYFRNIIQQIHQICTKRVILSLPVCRYSVSIMLNLPKFHDKVGGIVVPMIWKRRVKWNGEHYWEVGIQGHTRKQILTVLKRYFKIKNHYYVPENTYHWFIIMDKN